MPVVILTVWTLAGLGVAGWGVAKWRDRPLGITIWWLVGACFLLLSPAYAITKSDTVVLVIMLALILAFPALALAAEWSRRRERLQSRDLAIAAGMDPTQARRQYRRAPRGSITILAIYVLAAMAWIFTALGIVLGLGNDALATEPSWLITLGEGEPLDLPWWMAVAAAIEAVGVLHMLVNMVRRP